MNTAEIDTCMALLVRFTNYDVIQSDAESLLIRDRKKDDRAFCLLCAHLQRGSRCDNGQPSRVAIRVKYANLLNEFMHQIQRCDGFKGV